MAAPANADEVLAGRGIGGRRGDHDRVRHGAGLVEHRNDARDRGLLLTDRDVDGVERAVARIARRLRGLVQAGLADDRVEADGRLARRPVADDQLALAAADGNHRVDRHDPGLDGLVDRSAPDDAGRHLLDRIRRAADDRPLPVERLAERVHDPPEQAFAHGDLQQLARCAHLSAFVQLRVVPEDDDANLGLFQVEGEARDALSEVEHLVEHDAVESLDACDAVANLANHADRVPGGRRLEPREFLFEFLKQIGHRSFSPRAQKRAPSAFSRARIVPSYT